MLTVINIRFDKKKLLRSAGDVVIIIFGTLWFVLYLTL